MNTKSYILINSYKISNLFSTNSFLKIVGFPIRLTYKIVVRWLLSVDLSDKTVVGKNLIIYHGFGLVIHEDVIIGSNVVLRHCTTIGNRNEGGGCPVIQDNVNIGANVVIIGPVIIGYNSIIGAGSVVLKDVEPNSVYAGNPAVKIR